MSNDPMFTFDLESQIVVLTGASGGLGSQIARKFCDLGATVSLADINESKLVTQVATLRGQGFAVEGQTLDICDEEAVSDYASSLFQRYGRVDLLVNNAGVLTVSEVETLTLDDWNKVVSVNLTGTFLMSKAFSRRMCSIGSGSIVSVSSIGGKCGGPGIAHYVASKFGVIGFTQSLAMEIANKGVTVNAVCPGLVQSEMIEDLTDGWDLEVGDLRARQLIDRPQTGNDIAQAIIFLHKARCVTGQAINVDGGTVFN